MFIIFINHAQEIISHFVFLHDLLYTQDVYIIHNTKHVI